MKTTFKEIREFNPCSDGWEKLLKILNPESEMSKRVTILEILDSNGVKDAFWALRTQDYRDYCLILADVAESVLHIFEEKNKGDTRPREAIEAIRKWHSGIITEAELKNAADAAAYAAYAAYAAAGAAYAAAGAAAADAADDAASAAAYAAADAAADAAYAAAYAADAAAANAAAYAAAAAASQWEKNETILRNYIEVH